MNTEANPDEERVDPSRSAVLLLGGSEYPGTQLAPVPAAGTNLRELAEAFENPELWGVEDQVQSHLDLTRSRMLKAIRNTYRMTDPGGLFVLYFVGHAQQDSKGMLYLAPHDAGNPLFPEESMVSITDIYETVAAQERMADRLLLILDCCFSGSAIKAMPAEASTAGSENGWHVITACAPEEFARADADRRTTFFTGALLKSFEGVPLTQPSLSVQWVFEAVSDIIARTPGADDAKMLPHHAPAAWAQRPWLRNRRHIRPTRTPYDYADLATGGPGGPQPAVPHGFSAWPVPEALFVGRTTELEQARNRFRQRTVLPVYGPRYAGKSAFVRQLLAASEVKGSEPVEQPWLLLELTIINASAESPVMEALASALDVGLQDLQGGGQGTEADGDSRRDLVIDRLRERARGRTLLLVIDCGRLGYDSHRISAELDELLAHPYFRDTANIVISRVELNEPVHSEEQLDHQIPVLLEELPPEEAADLLTALMAQERVTVDGAEVMNGIADRRLRLPGVLNQSAKDYLRRNRAGGTGVHDAVAMAAGLVEGTTSSTIRTLRELGCGLPATPDVPGAPEPLAVLAAWALADQLPLPQPVLLDPAVGFPRDILDQLLDARVLSRTDSGQLLLGRAGEQALRNVVLAAVHRDLDEADKPGRPLVDAALLQALIPKGLTPTDLDHRLATAALPLFTAGAPKNDEVDGAYRVKLRQALGWIEDEGDQRLPALHEAIRPLVLAPSGDASYRPTSGEPLAPPTTTEQQTVPQPEPAPADQPAEEEGVTSLAALYRLYHAVASLTLAARAEGPAEQTGARFTTAAEEVSAALAGCDAEQVPHTLLRSADASLAFTGNRLGLRTRLLGVRLAAVDMLLTGARRRGPGQAGRITLTVSWLLNTADALIDADRIEEAGTLVEQADLLVREELPQDDAPRSVSSRLQLHSRTARLRGRLLTDTAESRQALLDGALSVVAGLRLAHAQGDSPALWTSRLFDAALLVVQQSRTDEELSEARLLVTDALEECWGDRACWPPSVSVPAARFLRKLHLRCSDPALRQSGAKEAVDLLEQLPEARSADPAAGAPANGKEAAKVLSALAQAYGFSSYVLRENGRTGAARNRLERAAHCAHTAVQLSPSTFSYSVWLRQILDIRRMTPRTGAAGDAAAKRRRACVKEVRGWLAEQDSRSYAHAMLDISCIDSDWAEEGSLRGAAQRRLPGGEDFLQIKVRRQRLLIDALHRERRQKLQTHRHRYGPSIALCALESRLEREYRRWSSVLDFKQAKQDAKYGRGPGPATRTPQVDNAPLFAIYRDAATRWPGDARLIAAEAALHRYVWDYAKAVSLYEYLARTAPNGEIRRSAHLSAAEALLADLEYTPRAQRRDEHDRLVAAQNHLDAAFSPNIQGGLVMVLRERLALRLGQPVNWAPVDEAFESVVGGDYAGTVGRFLDRRRYGRDRTSDQVGDRARFTVKGGAGSVAPDQLTQLLRKYGYVPEATVVTANSPSGGGDDPALSPDNDQEGALPTDPAEALVGVEDPGQYASELLGELLLTEFTSVRLLSGLGKLYLHRADDLITGYQKTHGLAPEAGSDTAQQAADHARRAYDCFDACRVLQEAHGNESIVTKFERGRAITLAARYLGDPNPISRPLPHERDAQLRQAFWLLNAAREHSVGGFNKVCSVAAADNNEVQGRLGLR
ncbi:caspase family protein [Streptomyces olivaceiscleroticus]|uniref:Peptidase C14 caspase domain-containing protein n=1 Tax=Streptomyces olivaceiscleroticus TaxID=68245 RepID=A0ABP3KGR3_9ACTN